jgi:serine/threonine protein kinase
MICTHCGSDLRSQARFCDQCGHSANSDHPGLAPTLPSDPFVGRVLNNKYELVERLGAGGMGAVYRAVNKTIHMRVAIKIILPQFAADEEFVERFRQEAYAIAQLHNPNVVTIHDLGETQEFGQTLPYIVMEFIQGPSLHNLIQSEGPLNPERAVRLMKDICAGVVAAHRRGVIHRDLKPANIIVLPPKQYTKFETVKVVDFGLAKPLRGGWSPVVTIPGQQLGTPLYMSPEQWTGDSSDLDARTDIYSLGVIMYEMLTGRPPFTGHSVGEIMWKHVNEVPPPFPAHLGVPPGLAHIILRALSKNPKDRPDIASLLVRDLEASLLMNGAGYEVIPRTIEAPRPNERRNAGQEARPIPPGGAKSNTRIGPRTISIRVGTETFRSDSVPDLYKQVLVHLVDGGHVERLSLPIATGPKRYLLAKDDRHQAGNKFFAPVGYKGYWMEAHTSRKTALAQLEKLMNLCRLPFEKLSRA